MTDLKTASEIEKHLQQITNEAAAFLKVLNAELDNAEAHAMDAAYMEQVEKRLTDANAAYEKTIEAWKVKLAEALKAEKQEAQEKQKAALENAAKVEADMKAKMLEAWTRAGGTPEAFEDAWPELYKREMTKRTLSNLDDDRNNAQRIIEKYY